MIGSIEEQEELKKMKDALKQKDDYIQTLLQKITKLDQMVTDKSKNRLYSSEMKTEADTINLTNKAS